MKRFKKSAEQIVIDQLANFKLYLSYNPNTGVFTWIRKPSRNVEIGDIAGCLDQDGYIKIGLGRRKYLAHRIAWLFVYGYWPDVTDHVNHDTTDNKIENLRDVSKRENSHNLEKQAEFIGVQKRLGKYRAYAWIDGKQRSLGTYVTPEEASNAYWDKVREIA